MKQKSGPDKAPAEQVLKDIRRQTRRQQRVVSFIWARRWDRSRFIGLSSKFFGPPVSGRVGLRLVPALICGASQYAPHDRFLI
jgi:hypothetical protein